MLTLLEYFAAFVTWLLVRMQPYWRKFEPIIRGIALIIVTLIVTFWSSVFIYLSCHFAYLPRVEVIRDLNFAFSSHCQVDLGTIGTSCSFPSDNITLQEAGVSEFSFGQSYKIFVELDVPESIRNNDIGMFIINLSLNDRKGGLLLNSRKSTMLKYRSKLLELIDTLVFAPFYLLGSKTQKQSLVMEMVSDFMDDTYNPVYSCNVTLESLFIQVYAAQIKIYANFSGLRHFMFYHPFLSAILGISTLFISSNFFLMVVLLRRQCALLDAQYSVNEDNSSHSKSSFNSPSVKKGVYLSEKNSFNTTIDRQCMKETRGTSNNITQQKAQDDNEISQHGPIVEVSDSESIDDDETRNAQTIVKHRQTDVTTITSQ